MSPSRNSSFARYLNTPSFSFIDASLDKVALAPVAEPEGQMSNPSNEGIEPGRLRRARALPSLKIDTGRAPARPEPRPLQAAPPQPIEPLPEMSFVCEPATAFHLSSLNEQHFAFTMRNGSFVSLPPIILTSPISSFAATWPSPADSCGCDSASVRSAALPLQSPSLVSPKTPDHGFLWLKPVNSPSTDEWTASPWPWSRSRSPILTQFPGPVQKLTLRHAEYERPPKPIPTHARRPPSPMPSILWYLPGTPQSFPSFHSSLWSGGSHASMAITIGSGSTNKPFPPSYTGSFTTDHDHDDDFEDPHSIPASPTPSLTSAFTLSNLSTSPMARYPLRDPHASELHNPSPPATAIAIWLTAHATLPGFTRSPTWHRHPLFFYLRARSPSCASSLCTLDYPSEHEEEGKEEEGDRTPRNWHDAHDPHSGRQRRLHTRDPRVGWADCEGMDGEGVVGGVGVQFLGPGMLVRSPRVIGEEWYWGVAELEAGKKEEEKRKERKGVKKMLGGLMGKVKGLGSRLTRGLRWVKGAHDS